MAVVAVEELKGWCFLCLCNNFESVVKIVLGGYLFFGNFNGYLLSLAKMVVFEF
jgi:hypothetical protein